MPVTAMATLHGWTQLSMSIPSYNAWREEFPVIFPVWYRLYFLYFWTSVHPLLGKFPGPMQESHFETHPPSGWGWGKVHPSEIEPLLIRFVHRTISNFLFAYSSVIYFGFFLALNSANSS